jgi:hypothetical protein
LVATVRNEAIKRFDFIHFIDSEVPNEKSLHRQYEGYVGKEFAATYSDYKNATNFDALGATNKAGGSITAGNFVYSPTTKRDEHGRSVISQYRIAGDPELMIVDFDDASTALVRKWAAKSGKVNVLVYPHHGSRENNIDSILDQRVALGLKDVIITVNKNNRYLHPAPEVFLKLLETLTPDHVHITGSQVGSNIRIGPSGVIKSQSPADHRKELAAFVGVQMDRYRARLRALSDQAELGKGVKRTVAESAGNLNKRSKALLASGKLSDRDAKKVQTLLAGLDAYKRSLDKIAQKPGGDDRALVAGHLRGPEPDGPPANYAPMPTSPNPGGDAYFEILDRNVARLGSRAAGPRPLVRSELATTKITFGGIVLGNDVTGPPMQRLEFANIVDGVDAGDSQVSIELTLANGEHATYADLTNAELWSAYNFVRPTAELLRAYPKKKLPSNAGGVIGIMNRPAGSRIALHPAFAHTRLGWDAIYVDLLREIAQAAADQQGPPLSISAVNWRPREWMQWFAAPVAIQVDHGLVRVSARGNPRECVMRLRFSEGPSSTKRESVRDRYFEQAMRQEASTQLGAEAVRSLEERGGTEAIEAALEERLGSTQYEILAAVLSTAARDVANRELEKADYFTGTELRDPRIWSLCSSLPALVRIDRVARVIAVLNWYLESSRSALPPLPEWIKPVRLSTPEMLDDTVVSGWASALAATGDFRPEAVKFKASEVIELTYPPVL